MLPETSRATLRGPSNRAAFARPSALPALAAPAKVVKVKSCAPTQTPRTISDIAKIECALSFMVLACRLTGDLRISFKNSQPQKPLKVPPRCGSGEAREFRVAMNPEQKRQSEAQQSLKTGKVEDVV
jgi:hypothetical protein